MKKNKLLILFIFIGIIASLVLSFNRIKIEGENKTVDFILDFDEMVKLSEQSDKDLSWWLNKFKGWGINSVALNEETFEGMLEENKPIEVEMLGNALMDINWKQKFPQELVNYLEGDYIDKYDVVGVTNSESLFKFIEKGLEERYSENKYKIFKGEKEFYFLLDGTEKDALYTKGIVLIDNNDNAFSEIKSLEGSKLMRLGLGYDENKIQTIKNAGLEVVLRPFNYNSSWIDKKYINTCFKEYQNYNIKPKYMIFTGKEVLGYPDYIDTVRDSIIDNNMKIALIESGVQRGHIEQAGIEGLTGALDYNAVRLFSVAPYIQERYKFYNYSGAEEIENTLYRAVTERNIRIILFRPFKQDKNSYVTDYKEYEKVFDSFTKRIAEHNMKLGDASTMRVNYINLVYKIMIGLAILGGGMILLDSIFDMNDKLRKLMIVLGVPFVAIVPFIVPNFSAKLYSLAAAIVFPSLSMVYLCNEMKKYYSTDNIKDTFMQSITLGIKILAIMVSITLIGALFVASLLSSIDYLLEMNIFRGVKFAQLIPILVYLFIFLGYFGYKRDKSKDNNRIEFKDLKEILFINIKVFTVLLGALVLGIGYIYIARTGHETNIQPSDLEMIARNFLELKLIARPRTKEFMFAIPAIILASYMILNKNKVGMFISGLVIVIGQTSIVNTFSHIRTPMYLSIIRTFYGILFGIILGIIYTALLSLGIKLVKKLRGELFNE